MKHRTFWFIHYLAAVHFERAWCDAMSTGVIDVRKLRKEYQT